MNRDVCGQCDAPVELCRCSALVAAAERKERERCAKICEQLQDWPEGATPYDCAKAIRAGRPV